MNGGYDDGYRSCSCFWGQQPGSLISRLLENRNVRSAKVLDLGCGEGKNAAAFARAGAVVDAIDCSELAIRNGMTTFQALSIQWKVGDVLAFSYPSEHYDYAIMYGVTHCLQNKAEIDQLISSAIKATVRGGIHTLVAFNSGSHDLEKAHPGFKPTLLAHEQYERFYSKHEILSSTDTRLEETHPHNGILHHHSLTRMTVRIG